MLDFSTIFSSTSTWETCIFSFEGLSTGTWLWLGLGGLGLGLVNNKCQEVIKKKRFLETMSHNNITTGCDVLIKYQSSLETASISQCLYSEPIWDKSDISSDQWEETIWGSEQQPVSAAAARAKLPVTVFENQTKMSYFRAWRQCLSLILKVIWIFTQKIDFLINQHSMNIFLARKFKHLKIYKIISFKIFGVRIQRDIFYNFKHNERTLSKSASNAMLKKEFIKTRHCSSKRTHIVSRFRSF